MPAKKPECKNNPCVVLVGAVQAAEKELATTKKELASATQYLTELEYALNLAETNTKKIQTVKRDRLSQLTLLMTTVKESKRKIENNATDQKYLNTQIRVATKEVKRLMKDKNVSRVADVVGESEHKVEKPFDYGLTRTLWKDDQEELTSLCFKEHELHTHDGKQKSPLSSPIRAPKWIHTGQMQWHVGAEASWSCCQGREGSGGCVKDASHDKDPLLMKPKEFYRPFHSSLSSSASPLDAPGSLAEPAVDKYNDLLEYPVSIHHPRGFGHIPQKDSQHPVLDKSQVLNNPNKNLNKGFIRNDPFQPSRLHDLSTLGDASNSVGDQMSSGMVGMDNSFGGGRLRQNSSVVDNTGLREPILSRTLSASGVLAPGHLRNASSTVTMARNSFLPSSRAVPCRDAQYNALHNNKYNENSKRRYVDSKLIGNFTTEKLFASTRVADMRRRCSSASGSKSSHRPNLIPPSPIKSKSQQRSKVGVVRTFNTELPLPNVGIDSDDSSLEDFKEFTHHSGDCDINRRGGRPLTANSGIHLCTTSTQSPSASFSHWCQRIV